MSYLLGRVRVEGRCPNFLTLYHAFQCASAPPAENWGAQVAQVAQVENCGAEAGERTVELETALAELRLSDSGEGGALRPNHNFGPAFNPDPDASRPDPDADPDPDATLTLAFTLPLTQS